MVCTDSLRGVAVRYHSAVSCIVSLVFDDGSARGRLGELHDLSLPRLHVISEVGVNLQQLGLQGVVSRAQQVDGFHASLDGPHVVFLKNVMVCCC